MRVLVLVGLLAAACTKPYANGYAVDLVVDSDGTLSAAELQTTKTLELDASGAEQSTASYQLDRPFDGGQERVIYRPAASGGDETFLVTARDAAGGLVGRASGTATLMPGHTATLALHLSKNGTDGGAGGLVVDRSSFDFGTFVTGQSATPHGFTITNGGGATTGTIGTTLTGTNPAAFSIEADTCAGKALAPGASCTLSVRLITATVGTPTANLGINAMSGGSAMTVLSATIVAPGTLSMSPTSADFGSIAQGQASAPLSFQVTNNGGSASGPLVVTLSGNDASLFGTPSGCAATALNAGASCTIMLSFAPGASATLGMKSATLVVQGTPGGLAPAELRANVIAPGSIGISPGFYDFGKINTGQMSATRSYTITNTGQSPTGALSTVVSGNVDQFSVVADQCMGQLLAAGASCMVSVRFAPTLAMTSTLVLAISATPGGTVPGTAIGVGGDFVTLTVTKSGNGSVSASGITCGTDCSELYDRNAMVVVSAMPDLTSRFGIWSGDACASSKLGVCTVTMDSNHTINAGFVARPAQNISFVTSTTVVPMSLGAAGADPLMAADAICMGRALQGGLSGTYKAYLSTSMASAQSRLGTASGWVRPDGNPMASTLASLQAGKILFVPRLDETGTAVADDPNLTTQSSTVATGSDMNGAYLAGQNCGDWKTASTYEYGVATTGTEAWNALGGGRDCMQAAHLYCFETTYNTGVSITPPGSFRRAFVTEGVQMPPTGGIATADAVCNAEKTTYSTGGGTYLALLTPTGMTAASRFNTTGAPWARLDGVLLAPTAAAFFDDSINAALNLTPAGHFIGFADAGTPKVVTGDSASITMNATDAENCTSWTSAANNAFAGRAPFADKRWGVGVFAPCAATSTVRFYCLEQ